MRIDPTLRKALLVGATALVAVATSAPLATTTASATSSTMRVTGPTSNLMHQNFNETISGFAVSPANYVVAWEQYYKRTGCAATFAQESTRSFFSATYGLTTWLAHPVTAGRSYSVVARFGAANLGTHGMCAYLINLSTGTTYAHGAIWWTNHT